jgi:threonine/homoserine/homoserine lactone efflux protein
MRKTGKVALTSALIGVGIFFLHLAVDNIGQNDSRVFVWGIVAVVGFFAICFVVAFCWFSVARLVSSRRKSRTPESASHEEIN